MPEQISENTYRAIRARQEAALVEYHLRKLPETFRRTAEAMQQIGETARRFPLKTLEEAADAD